MMVSLLFILEDLLKYNSCLFRALLCDEHSHVKEFARLHHMHLEQIPLTLWVGLQIHLSKYSQGASSHGTDC